MGRIEQVCDVLGQAITVAITAAGIVSPAQVYIGWPVGTELTELINQGGYAVTIYPLPGGRRLAPRGKDISKSMFPTPTVSTSVATGANTQLIISGTPGIYNFNVLFVHPILGRQFVYYRSTGNDTLSTIATAIAALFSTVPSPVTATASGSSVTISGATGVKCNVGTVGSVTSFASRFEQRIQVSVWTPTAYQNTGNPSVDTPLSLRSAVCDAIINAVGTDMNMWYVLPDGTYARIRLSAIPAYKDDSQADYNLYEAHLIFLVEYVLQTTLSATQVGVIEETTTIGDETPLTIIGG